MVTITGWLLMVTCVLASAAALLGWGYAMGVFAVTSRRTARAARPAIQPPPARNVIPGDYYQVREIQR